MKRKVTYRIVYGGLEYRIRCVPLTYQFSRWLAQQAGQPEEVVIDGILRASEAEALDDNNAWTSKIKDELPIHVLRLWMKEAISGLEAETNATIQIEKNS